MNVSTLLSRHVAQRLTGFVFVALLMGVILFPVAYILSASFMEYEEIYGSPPRLLPSSMKLNNYVAAVTTHSVLRYMYNSFVVTALGLVTCVASAAMAAYALVRTRIRFKKVYLLFVLAVTLLPGITIINPIFRLYNSVGLLNTYLGLALLLGVLELPVSIWFLTAYLKNIPIEIEESAFIDGASLRQLFVKILMPLLAPGIFSVSILVFVGVWNSFLLPQVLNNLESHRTVIVGIALLKREDLVPFGMIAAASVITILPLVTIVLVFQKRILGGIFEGGVKY